MLRADKINKIHTKKESKERMRDKTLMIGYGRIKVLRADRIDRMHTKIKMQRERGRERETLLIR